MHCLLSMTTARCRRCWKTQNRKCQRICFPAVTNSRKAEGNVARSFPFFLLLLHYALLATLMKLARAWSWCLQSCIRGWTVSNRVDMALVRLFHANGTRMVTLSSKRTVTVQLLNRTISDGLKSKLLCGEPQLQGGPSVQFYFSLKIPTCAYFQECINLWVCCYLRCSWGINIMSGAYIAHDQQVAVVCLALYHIACEPNDVPMATSCWT